MTPGSVAARAIHWEVHNSWLLQIQPNIEGKILQRKCFIYFIDSRAIHSWNNRWIVLSQENAGTRQWRLKARILSQCIDHCFVNHVQLK